jgi:MYXO-CTERM domain-containing protein
VCGGACVSCNQAGRAGRCTPYAAGADPENECPGTDKCKSNCDGVGACAFPQSDVTCRTCYLCDGAGECSIHNDVVCGSGGSSGSGGRSANGGSGGSSARGGSGGSSPRGGSGGGVAGAGGAAGHASVMGGNAGSPGDAASDAGSANLHKSGCGCTLADGAGSGAGVAAPVWLVGVAVRALRRRRRKDWR